MGYGDATGVSNTCPSINEVQARIESALTDLKRGVSCFEVGQFNRDLVLECLTDAVKSLEGLSGLDMEEIRDANTKLREFGTAVNKERDELQREKDDLEARVAELESEVVELKEEISELEFGGQTEEQ